MASSSRGKLLNPTQYHIDQQQQQHQHQHQPGITLPLYDQAFQSPLTFGGSGDPDDFSQAFMSPMAPLDDLDDLDYKPGMYADQHHSHHQNYYNHGHAPWQQGPESPPPFPTATAASPSMAARITGAAAAAAAAGSLPPAHFVGPMSAPANILSTTSQPYAHQQRQDHHHHHQPNQPEIAKSLEDDFAVQVNLQMIMDKRRRRRESHNAVERRRRDNINDRIQELGNMLPEAMLDNGNYKPNKGIILKKSVDHIRYLQQEVNAYQQRILELENLLNMLHRSLPQ